MVFAILFRVPKKVMGEGILLIKHDRLAQIRALGTGRIEDLNVDLLGQDVHPGSEIGRILQKDLKDTISETEARILELKKEDDRLSQFEHKEQDIQEQAIARLRKAIQRTIENSHEGLGVALKIVNGSDRLRLISQLSNLDYLKDLQQKYAIQNELNNGETKLAEVELTRLTSENQRQRAKLQRQLEISRLETRLDLEQKKLRRTSQHRQSCPRHRDPDPHRGRSIRSGRRPGRAALVTENSASRHGGLRGGLRFGRLRAGGGREKGRQRETSWRSCRRL